MPRDCCSSWCQYPTCAVEESEFGFFIGKPDSDDPSSIPVRLPPPPSILVWIFSDPNLAPFQSGVIAELRHPPSRSNDETMRYDETGAGVGRQARGGEEGGEAASNELFSCESEILQG